MLITKRFEKTCALSILALILFTASPGLADSCSGNDGACAHIATLLTIANGELLYEGPLAAGETRCYPMTVPEAGWLLLDAAIADNEAWLGWKQYPAFGHTKIRASGFADATELLATPGQRLLRIDGALDLMVCLASQDPRHSATSTTLRTAFVPAAKNQEMEIEPDGDKNQEMEIEPDGDKNQEIEIERIH